MPSAWMSGEEGWGMERRETGGRVERERVLVRFLFYFIFFVKLTQATRVIREEGTSREEPPPSDWPLDKLMGTFY